jgi:hypothetical protein
MTVENQTFEVNAPTSASTFIYSFSPIVLFAKDDLQVIITNNTTGVETTLTRGTGATNYAVVVSKFPGTGSITYPANGITEAGTGSILNMKRVLTLEQATDLENQGGYFPDTLEQQLDKGIMIDLQQQEEIDRTFKASPGESTLTILTVPNTSTVTGAANLGLSADHTKLEFNVSAGTLPDPVSVARGGTGANTASAGLTALGGIGAATTDTLTNKTFDANGTGNSLSNVDVADLANGTDGELITWNASAVPSTVAVGASGQVLTSAGAGSPPTFQTVAANTLEFVSTTAITAATTIEVNNLEIGYDYIIQLEAFSLTDDSQTLEMRFSDDGIPNYESDAGDYQWAHQEQSGSTRNNSATSINLSSNSGNDANSYSSLSITLINPMGTSEKTTCRFIGHRLDVNFEMVSINGAGLFLQGTNNVTDVQLFWSGGSTFKAQGDITVWRRKRS